VNTAAAAAVAAVVAVIDPTRIFRAGFGQPELRLFLFYDAGEPAAGWRTPSPLFPARLPMKEEHIEVEGRVMTVLPGTMFRVELTNKHLVLATICGKMRKRWVRLTVGDRVKMEMSPYDLDKARITWRLK
jgi:translation initiation factor IF-1